MPQHKLQKYFSEEVARQINQFAIDIIDDILSEIDAEVNHKPMMTGMTAAQYSAFQVILEQARHKVLARYELLHQDQSSQEINWSQPKAGDKSG